MRVVGTLALALLGLSAPLAAQSGSPRATTKPITQDVYDLWKSVQGATLSDDGRWAAYSVAPAVGDGELIVRATSDATEYRVPRGFLGRPVTSVRGGGAAQLPPARFTADSRWVVALAYAPMAEFDAARRAEKKAADQPKASLALVSLADGQVTTVPRVQSFKLAERGGRFVAYLLEPPPGAAAPPARDSAIAAAGAAAATPGGVARPVAGDSTGEAKPEKETGSVLVVRDLTSGAEVRVPDVTDYEFDDRGAWLGYTVSSADSTRDGAYVRDLAAQRETPLLTGAGHYKQLAFDEAGRQVAFVSDRDEYGREQPRYALYHAALPAGRATAVVAAGAVDSGEVVADLATVSFVKNGSALLFGVGPAPLDSIPADSLADKAVFDLWHYQDARLQPQQIVEAGRDRGRSYTAIYHIGARTMTRLASDSLPSVSVSDDGRTALAVTDVAYSVEETWGDGGNDVYLLNTTTGARTTVAERVQFRAELSPDGKYVLYFDDGRWHSYAVATGKRADLTGGLEGVRFDEETWNRPSTPAPWGVAGWTPDDQRLLLYDRYDVWEVDPAGVRAARVVTDSAGRRGQLVFRLVTLDEDDRDDDIVDPDEPLLLRVFNERTKASGFWEDRLGMVQPPREIMMADRDIGVPRRAQDASVYLVTQETVQEYPDLWVGPSLTSLTKISDANPQQREYPWPQVELVSWRSLDGIPLQGLLYKPENFDPSRQYPMVVYFYERHSDNLYSYVVPAGRNVVNPVVYTSLDYLVFFPDIAYEEGYPGQSALHSVVPGVQSLVARGFVNPDAIASAGQSWGGYQTAYMVTQTDIFKAAVANAPVANMTSAYGGIRWESGRARAFQYEKTQSRIGGSIWEYPMRYIENSPLFYADRIETPLLMMHNDGDGAVPWYQGIEMFVAMRRFGKEAYLINYNGDAHNPRKRANQKDIDMRMQQFLGYHLKGEPMADWMEHGIPFLQKGRDQIATPTPRPEEPVAQPERPAEAVPARP